MPVLPGTFLDGENLDALIEENGGLGDHEEPQVAGETERWAFPRFAGADAIGTCSDENGNPPAGHEGNHVQHEDCGENFAADMGNLYLSRKGLDPHDTDVEMLVSWLAAPRNVVGAVLLLGEPGCGKTALIEAAITHAERNLMTVVCTPDHTKDSLFLRFVGEGKGDPVDPDCDPEDAECVRSPYTLGPIPYAAKHGLTLYMDEFMLLIDGVKPLVYPLADGRRFLPEGNIDGSPMEVHPDFRLILSSNPQVRGASLPEPVGSRCASTTLTVETSAALLHDLNIDESIVAAWEHLGTSKLWRPQVRELRMADYWLPISVTQAVSAFLPEHCPASDRAAVRDAVVSYLGGNIRSDGRLVVS